MESGDGAAPARRRCPHGRDSRECAFCASAARDWPCRNGCTDPADHDPRYRYTRCTVFPPRRPSGPDGRCADDCQSTEAALSLANPGMSFDPPDDAERCCYHCGKPI